MLKYHRIEAEHTKSLVLFLHGYGSNGADLISIGKKWKNKLPHTTFIAPNAPERLQGTFDGYQWFPIQSSPQVYRITVKEVCDVVHKILTKECARYHLDEKQVVLVGFSQGAILSLVLTYVLGYGSFGGVIAYSGALLPYIAAKDIKDTKTPLLVVQGDADTMIPLEDVKKTLSTLEEEGIALTFQEYRGLGHTISPEGISRGQAFLQSHLGTGSIELNAF